MKFSKHYCVPRQGPLRLAKWDSADTAGWDKDQARKKLTHHVERLAELQEQFYADGRRSLLVILQGMDASGKDGTIRHVLSGLNPQGCQVTSFKTPTPVERAHDFLWRVHQAVPARGMIGIFNRSHYEEVLVVRVNQLAPPAVWKSRYDQINDFQRLLVRTGTVIVKFFLHISKAEQKQRLQARLEDPRKNWKFNPEDLEMREQWPGFQRAYADALRRCHSRHAPWYIIPADHKWFRNLVVSSILVETLAALDLRFPKPTTDLSKIKIR